MSEYDITIEGYESGLTAETVRQMFQEQFGSIADSIVVEERTVNHAFEVGDYAIDKNEPTPSPEKNTVEIVGLTQKRANELVIDELDKTVAECDNNAYYPPNDPVVIGTYPNMSSDKLWHFPESRLSKQ